MDMDPEFTAYLVTKRINLNKYEEASIGDQASILTAFESSRKGDFFLSCDSVCE